MTPTNISLALLGAGKMGGALLAGWLDRGVAPAGLIVIDPAPSSDVEELCARTGVRLNPDRASLAPPDVLVLALKPQAFDQAAAGFADLLGPGALVISIMAGKTIADIRARLPGAIAIVRAMPNTPAAVRRGISGVVAENSATRDQRDLTQELLSAVGAVEWLPDESLMNAVTAVSGSGPAYVFLLTEYLAKAGVAEGLPAALAEKLARATVEGAGELMTTLASEPPEQLRRNVTSPGGTTAAALEVLMASNGLEPLLRRAVEAARKRGEQLSG